jgi:hypothetical protein
MLQTAEFQFVDQREQQPRARRPERVSERHGAAVDVQAIHVDPERLRARDRLRSERFVDFEEVDVLDRQPRLREEPLGRRDRTERHDARVESRDVPTRNARTDSEARRVGLAARRDDESRGPVDDARRVARGHESVLAERGTQLGQPFEGRLGFDVIVLRHGDFRAALLDLDRGDFTFEAPGGDRLRAELMTAVRVGIRVRTGHAVLRSPLLRRLRHEGIAVGVVKSLEEVVGHLRLDAEADSDAHLVPVDAERRLGHVLHAARDGHARIAHDQHVGRVDHALNARSADAVHGQRGRRHRDARLERRVTSAVMRVDGRLHGVAHDDVIHGVGLHSRVFESGTNRVTSEVGGRQVLEQTEAGGSAVFGHGGSLAADDHDFRTGHDGSLQKAPRGGGES